MPSDPPLIYGAMLDVMAELEAVKKGQTNQQQGYKFRGIDDLQNALHGLMAKHGVLALPTVQERESSVRETSRGGNMWAEHHRILYTFWARDGSSVTAEVWGEGTDSADKATAKACTSAFKTVLLQGFMIPTEDQADADRGAEETKPSAAPKPVRVKNAPEAEPVLPPTTILAMAAEKAGFKPEPGATKEQRDDLDKARRDVLEAVLGVRSTKDISKPEDFRKALETFEGIAAKTHSLRYDPAGKAYIQEEPF